MEIGDPDAWDDTALVQAFETAIDAHNNPGKKLRKSARQTAKKAEREASSPGGTLRVLKKPRTGEPHTEQAPARAPAPAIELPPAARADSRDAGVRIPPPPPSTLGVAVPEDVEKLLLAWYEAGYRAGHYAAKNER